MFPAVVQRASEEVKDKNGIAISRGETGAVLDEQKIAIALKDGAFGKGIANAVETEIGQIERCGCRAIKQFDERCLGRGRIVLNFVDDHEILRPLDGTRVKNGDARLQVRQRLSAVVDAG